MTRRERWLGTLALLALASLPVAALHGDRVRAAQIDLATVDGQCPASMVEIDGTHRPLWFCQHVSQRTNGLLHGVRCVLMGQSLPIPEPTP